jgi:predicted transcriptional regulator of viral defense system
MDDRRSDLGEFPEKMHEFVDRLQASGRYTFTGKETAEVLGRSAVAREAALRRLKKSGRIVSPRRGFFVIVPIEYRPVGSPPPTWFIDQLMASLDQAYYVGLLTAAEIHGAAHQRPQVFQVVTEVATRPVEVARIRIEFHRNRNLHGVPLERFNTETGTMLVSTPEATAIDLIRYSEACGHLDNVATVLVELAERIDAAKLARLAAKAPAAAVQRLGYLLERLGLAELAEPLAEVINSRRKRAVLLRPDLDEGSPGHDPRWYVIANQEIESEI